MFCRRESPLFASLGGLGARRSVRVSSLHCIHARGCQSCRVEYCDACDKQQPQLSSRPTIMMGACDKVVRHGQPSCGRMLSTVCHVVFVERPDDVDSRNHQDPFGVYPGRPRRASCLDRGWCFKLRSLTTACISVCICIALLYKRFGCIILPGPSSRMKGDQGTDDD